MNAKERFLKAFKHEKPDRIPVFEQAFYSDVASKILNREVFTGGTSLHYEETKAWMKGESAHTEFVDKMREDVLELYKVLEFDAMHVPWRLTEKPAKKIDEHTFFYGDEKENWVIRRYDPASKTFGDVDSSERAQALEDLEKYVDWLEKEWSDEITSGDFTPQLEDLKYFISKTGKTMGAVGGSGIVIPPTQVWLEAVLLNPELVGRYLDCQVKADKKRIKIQKEMGVDAFWAGGDMADKNGPLYSPKVFHNLLFPRLKEICDYCHSLGVFYLFRSDGNLWPVADDLFGKSGVDAYGEIDYSAGMRMKELRQKFPKLTMWGNVSCGDILFSGTKQQVIDVTKECIEATNGIGLIIGSSNSILPGTPVKNVLAMYETAKSYKL
ncbi:MAG: hypothetical protein A3J83_02220 [Elusimicrobia bacterium RIFOXYA2_FULL_40_6]|nr:MAG: hypothetical protein A3J83_02220 [Elusimicrobia bacterium RIFOXYA2_FULL_40_6]